MPYGIHKKGNVWLTVNKNTGKVFGKHPTEEKAAAQMRALYANAPHDAKGDANVRPQGQFDLGHFFNTLADKMGYSTKNPETQQVVGQMTNLMRSRMPQGNDADRAVAFAQMGPQMFQKVQQGIAKKYPQQFADGTDTVQTTADMSTKLAAALQSPEAQKMLQSAYQEATNRNLAMWGAGTIASGFNPSYAGPAQTAFGNLAAMPTQQVGAQLALAQTGINASRAATEAQAGALGLQKEQAATKATAAGLKGQLETFNTPVTINGKTKPMGAALEDAVNELVGPTNVWARLGSSTLGEMFGTTHGQQYRLIEDYNNMVPNDRPDLKINPDDNPSNAIAKVHRLQSILGAAVVNTPATTPAPMAPVSPQPAAQPSSGQAPTGYADGTEDVFGGYGDVHGAYQPGVEPGTPPPPLSDAEKSRILTGALKQPPSVINALPGLMQTGGNPQALGAIGGTYVGQIIGAAVGEFIAGPAGAGVGKTLGGMSGGVVGQKLGGAISQSMNNPNQPSPGAPSIAGASPQTMSTAMGARGYADGTSNVGTETYGPGPGGRGVSPTAGQNDPQTLTRIEQQYGLPTGLLHAIGMVESSGGTNVGHGPAQGTYQVLPSTAANPGYGVPPDTSGGNNPVWVAKYLSALKNATGSWSGAVMAYNQGVKGMGNAASVQYLNKVATYVPQVALGAYKPSGEDQQTAADLVVKQAKQVLGGGLSPAGGTQPVPSAIQDLIVKNTQGGQGTQGAQGNQNAQPPLPQQDVNTPPVALNDWLMKYGVGMEQNPAPVETATPVMAPQQQPTQPEQTGEHWYAASGMTDVQPMDAQDLALHNIMSQSSAQYRQQQENNDGTTNPSSNMVTTDDGNKYQKVSNKWRKV